MLPFAAEWASGSRFLSRFLAEDGDSIKVESTIVPFLRMRLRSVRSDTACANRRCYRLFSINRFESVPMCLHPEPGYWIQYHRNLKRCGCRSLQKQSPCPKDCTGSESCRCEAFVPDRRACYHALLYSSTNESV